MIAHGTRHEKNLGRALGAARSLHRLPLSAVTARSMIAIELADCIHEAESDEERAELLLTFMGGAR